MKNYVEKGDVLEYTNSTGSDIASGDVVVSGSIVGVAMTDIADTETGSVQVEGVVRLTKKAALAITQGDMLFWDSTPGEITKTAADGVPIGVAFTSQGGSDTTVDVKLSGRGTGLPQAAAVSFSAGSNLAGVDGAGSNAAPLAGTETRLDALDTAVAAIITSLKAADLMAQ